MHILVNSGGMMLIVLLGCLLIVRQLSFRMSWTTRCMLHLIVLSLPLASSLPLIGGWIHVSSWCWEQNTPHWDRILDLLLVLLLSITALGALLYGGLRLLCMHWLMRKRTTAVDPQLQAQVDRWAQLRGIAPVAIRICAEMRPLALTYGIRRPEILLSRWMLAHLDKRELEAVITHELMHIARHDYLVNWIATMLRDAFFYLPTSRRAYQQFRKEKEIVCDDLVVAATHRPLALASALTKVWLYEGEQPPSSLAPLLDPHQPVTSRVHRLLSYSSASQEKKQHSLSGLLAVGVAIPTMLIGLALMSTEICCGFNDWIWHLL
ncbi:MAG TPA: M56 family metallopeptidase [Ktedonobacteraceae bacterium]|jgi:beta-lactamase regulating signal transducer with metallopeptidase domain